MRYLRQRDHFRCGVIAAINLDKWRGKSVTSKDIKRYSKKLKCTPPGIPACTLAKWLGKRKRRMTWQQLKEHLQNNGVVIVHLLWKTGGHYFFIDQLMKKRGKLGVRAINYDEKHTYMFLSSQTMCSILWRHTLWAIK